MPMRVLIHDDGCGEFLDMDGECPRCGFLPDEASVSPVDVAPEDMRKGLSGGRTYLAPGGMRIQGWREPRDGRGVGHPGRPGSCQVGGRQDPGGADGIAAGAGSACHVRCWLLSGLWVRSEASERHDRVL